MKHPISTRSRRLFRAIRKLDKKRKKAWLDSWGQRTAELDGWTAFERTHAKFMVTSTKYRKRYRAWCVVELRRMFERHLESAAYAPRV